jgi:hypothetical protein
MPNWNSNTIYIAGPADKIRALWQRAQSGHFYTNALTGLTEETGGLLAAMVPIGEWDYDRAVAAWGTKWDISLDNLRLLEHTDGRASIEGTADSAWSPPIEAFEQYAEQNPDVTAELEYNEPGMAFAGHWRAENGVVVMDHTWDTYDTEEDEEDADPLAHLDD